MIHSFFIIFFQKAICYDWCQDCYDTIMMLHKTVGKYDIIVNVKECDLRMSIVFTSRFSEEEREHITFQKAN